MNKINIASHRHIIRLRAGFVDRLKQIAGAPKIFSLVGKSGTGKSFRAKIVAETYGIDYIIDDGLLIHNNSIVAGKSAKREKQYMSAVRTALFDDTLHRNSVIKAIQSRKIKKILIIGTSERMVAKTAKRLKIAPPSKTIFIEEISSMEDIQIAQKSRNEDGKHVIPVPTVEIERDYPHLLSKSIKILSGIKRGLGVSRKSRHHIFEKSVVQPLFHNKAKGKVAVSEIALGQMIAHCVDEFGSQGIVHKVRVRSQNGGYSIRAELEIGFGHHNPENIHELRNYIIDRIEKFIGVIILEINLVVTHVSRQPRKSLIDTDIPESN